MNNTEIFYHGSYRLFDHFTLNHLGEGEGKSKFGHGIYITSSYKTAALYAGKAGKRQGARACPFGNKIQRQDVRQHCEFYAHSGSHSG